MTKLLVGDQAPDFELPDHHGNLLHLSQIYKDQYALLVFNIGFS
jgi:peroxiredoxin